MRNLTLDEVFVAVVEEAPQDPINQRLGDVSMEQLLAHHTSPLQNEVAMQIGDEEEDFDDGSEQYF